MKVLSISTHFNIGGISNYILTLAAALKKRGVETIVASSGGDLVPELNSHGIKHVRIPVATKFEFDPRLLIAALALRGTVKAEGVDIIHAHSRVSQVVAYLLSGMTGIPVVTTCHGYFKLRLRRLFDTWGSKVIAISRAVKEHLISDLKVSANRVELVYSGIDPDRFDRDYSDDEIRRAKTSLGLKDGPVVGTIGRLSSVKGQRYLVEALATVMAERRDVQGLIIGGGPEKIALETQARSMGISDSLKFVNSTVDTHRFLSLMDIFVFPSVKEGLGIALLEALASARPSIASDIGGIGDIIKDGSDGILVKVGDPSAIAEAVIKLLDNKVLAAELGRQGRELVRKRFTLDRMAGEIAGIYKGVIGR